MKQKRSDLEHTVADGITVMDIRDIQQLENQADAINAFLIDPLVHANLYHFADYIKSTVEDDETIADWSVLLIQDDGQLVAMIPLLVSNNKYPVKFALFTLFNFKINQLNLLGSSISYRSDYNLSSIHSILKQHLQSSLRFDLGILHALAVDNPILTDFQGQDKGDFVIKPLSKKFEVVRYLQFPESWDDYIASMKRKRRYNLKRNIKIINEKCNNDVVLKCYESGKDVEPFLLAMDEIYETTWQSTAFGYKSRVSGIEMHQNMALSQKGCLKSYILFASQSPIAFVRGYLFKGKYYYEEIGYKPDWASYNPGSVLNYLMLQHLMEGDTPVSELNFGYGENIYKQVFSNGDYEATNGFLYRAGTKGNYIFLLQKNLDAFYSVTRKIIVKLNLEVVIRRLLRKKIW